MHTKTMEGLVGARTNMNLLNTPMRVFKDARRRGDTATMERAIGYVSDFSKQAQEYKAEADKGMEEDARQAREKAKLQQEEAVLKRKEERKKIEEKLKEESNADTQTNPDTDMIQISEEGKELLEDSAEPCHTSPEKQPVTYTKTAEVVAAQPDVSISVSV